jgi:hypothetical protein
MHMSEWEIVDAHEWVIADAHEWVIIVDAHEWVRDCWCTWVSDWWCTWVSEIVDAHEWVIDDVHEWVIADAHEWVRDCWCTWVSDWWCTWVSEWLLVNANSAIFQLYHGENKLIFNEIMIGPLNSRPTRWGFFYSASSLKQQSAGRHIAPLEHIILIPSQPVFVLSP